MKWHFGTIVMCCMVKSLSLHNLYNYDLCIFAVFCHYLRLTKLCVLKLLRLW